MDCGLLGLDRNGGAAPSEPEPLLELRAVALAERPQEMAQRVQGLRRRGAARQRLYKYMLQLLPAGSRSMVLYLRGPRRRVGERRGMGITTDQNIRADRRACDA